MQARSLKKDAITPSTLQILEIFFCYALVDISDEGMTDATTATRCTGGQLVTLHRAFGSRGGTEHEKPSSHTLTLRKCGDLAFS